MTSFPDIPLDLRTELNLGGTWTDVSAYNDHGPTTIGRGHPDESTTTSPSTLSLTLTNNDGRFTSKNPVSPYYPNLGRNVACRVSVPSQTNYMRLESDTVSSAAAAPITAITGDTDIRLDMKLTDYRSCALASVFNTSTNFAWALALNDNGTLNFLWLDSGAALHVDTSTVPIPYGRIAIRVTEQVNTPSGSHTTTFYTAPSIAGPWTQLGSALVVSGTVSIYSATGADVVAGWSSGFQSWTGLGGPYGNIYALQLYSGIGGTLKASPDFTAQTAGVPSFTDAQSNVWTLFGSAEISSRNYRIHAEMPEWPQNQDPTGKTVTVAAAGGGLLRRLGQRNNPVQSAMYRAYTQLQSYAAPVAYWPMEDGAGATQLASAIGGPAMDIAGSPQLASSSAFAASNPLPVMNGATFTGDVPSGATWTDNVIRFLMDVPSGGDPNNSLIVTVSTRGTVATLNLLYGTASGGTLGLTGYDSTGSSLFTSGAIAFAVDGEPLRVGVGLQDAGGGNLTWSIQTLVPGASSASSQTGTVSGTIGAVTRVQFNPAGGGQLTQTALGHASVQPVWDSLFDLDDYENPAGYWTGALNAWIGEPAGRRFVRLCNEEGIQVRTRGDLDGTSLMGAQTTETIARLLQECADADRGIWTELRQQLGFGYITRSALYNQAPAVTVDYDQDHLEMWSSNPIEDDQTTINDVTLTKTSDGSSSRQFAAPGQPITGGHLSTLAPPSGVGTYDQAYSVNLQHDSDLDNLAGWIIHTGTVDQPRYPGIVLDLTNRDLASLFYTILDLDLGDRLVINNPPKWLPPDPVSVLAQQLNENLWGEQLDITVTGVPEQPYEVAADGAAHLDTDGSQLAAAASSSATTLEVATTSGPAWTEDSGDMPFDVMVAGERMTVTAIGAGSPALCHVGAYLSNTALGAADFNGAYTAWQSLTGLTFSVTRTYYAASSFGVPLRTDVQEMITAGIKICIDLKPAYSPLSSTDLANMTTFLQALKTAGAVCDISLWHEPNYAGLTATQYVNMIRYYGPTVRAYYPLVCCFSGTDANAANGYYPGDAWCDKIAVDAYCYSYDTGSTQITDAAAMADGASPPKPLGIWELNSSTDPVNGQSQAQADAYFAYVQSFMAAREAAGKANADLIFFSSGNGNSLGTGLTAEAGFEGGTGTWGQLANCTIAASTAQAHSGTHSLAITATGTSNMGTKSTSAAGYASGMAVTPGQTVSASAWFRAATIGRNCQVGVIFYTSGGSSVSTTFGSSAADSTSAWTQAVITNLTVPATAAWAIVTTQVISPGGSGEVHYLDDVQLTIDGASPNLTTPVQFSWDYRIGLLSSLQSALDGTSAPQAFTVTRSVNGVVKAQEAGAAVNVYPSPVAAL